MKMDGGLLIVNIFLGFEIFSGGLRNFRVVEIFSVGVEIFLGGVGNFSEGVEIFSGGVEIFSGGVEIFSVGLRNFKRVNEKLIRGIEKFQGG